MILYKLIGYDLVKFIYTNPNNGFVDKILPSPFLIVADSTPNGYENIDSVESWAKYGRLILGSSDIPNYLALRDQIVIRIEVICGEDYTNWDNLTIEQKNIAIIWCNVKIINSRGMSFYSTECGGQDNANEFLDTYYRSSIQKGSDSHWVSITRSHADFQSASLSRDIEIYMLPPKVILHGVVTKHSIQFSGTGISSYSISVGVAGSLGKYSSPFVVSSVSSDSNFQISQTYFCESWGIPTSVRTEAISIGANLDQSTQGEVTIFLLVSQIKPLF